MSVFDISRLPVYLSCVKCHGCLAMPHGTGNPRESGDTANSMRKEIAKCVGRVGLSASIEGCGTFG
eukprot:7962773-Lingulodinium_polyedra.AAC.1